MRGIDKKIDAAKKMLLDFFSTVEKPYCAISGGKDSLVSLDLAMSVAPGTFDVCWGDEDFNMPGTREQISAIEHHYAIKVTRIRVRHGAREFRDMFGCYPACENPHPVDFEADTGKEVTAHFGWDGVILGLRSEESRQRRYAMTNPLRTLSCCLESSHLDLIIEVAGGHVGKAGGVRDGEDWKLREIGVCHPHQPCSADHPDGGFVGMIVFVFCASQTCIEEWLPIQRIALQIGNPPLRPS